MGWLRDTVRDGIDGFRIPSRMPPPGYGDELASRHALGIDNYDMYCAHTSSLVAIDIPKATQAFIELISSSEMRRKMGEQGRKHVMRKFDWKSIVPIYENLWSELKSRRDSASDFSRKPRIRSSRLDPFYAFASYPTKKIHPKTLLHLSDPDIGTTLSRFHELIKLDMVNYVMNRMVSEQKLKSLLMKLSYAPASLDNISMEICSTKDEQRKLFLSAVWMVKLGLIKV